MNTTTATWPGLTIVQPAIERPTAMRLAQTEYQRVTDAVDALQPDDWSRPTDCTEWDVRQLVAHIVGQTNLFSTPLELARQERAAKARQQPGRAEVDALTAPKSRSGSTSGPTNCAPSCIGSARVAPRDAAGFPASYAADAYRGRKLSTDYRRDGHSVTSPM
jgi:uncharacterized protein (TIGR03083 family)